MMVVVFVDRAVERFGDPDWPRVAQAPQWYDEALNAVLYAVIAGASVAYLRRKWPEWGVAAPGRTQGRPSRWRERTEWRFVLYSVAALLMVRFPIGVFTTVRAMEAAPRELHDRFLSLFPMEAWVSPLGGVAIVIYDRRRLRREAGKEPGICAACGYDLRASAGRCPECGTAIPV